MRVALLAGGVGGARFARGLVAAVGAENVTAIVNVGDDFVHWGLSISPDLDTVLYTLAGRIDPANGWGVAGDTYEAMQVCCELGGADWFQLGDRDLGLHVARSERLRRGERLSTVTAAFAERLGVRARVLPATDDPLWTRIVTAESELEFQQWLVRRRAIDRVVAVRFEGSAAPAPGVLEALAEADRIVLAPSNPFVSLDPILAVHGIRAAVAGRRADVVAITPIIDGEAVKGPLVAMLESLGHAPGVVGALGYLAPIAGVAVVDERDRDARDELGALFEVRLAQTLMHDAGAAQALAEVALA